VEFSRNPTERFKTLPAVNLAVKMSQLKVSLELSVHAAEEIEGKVQGGSVSKLRNTRYFLKILCASVFQNMLQQDYWASHSWCWPGSVSRWCCPRV
jgi:hypothetical protein